MIFFSDHLNIKDNLVSISPSQALKYSELGAIIVDCRKEYEIEYKSIDLENVISFDTKNIENEIIKLPKNKPMIIIDSTGITSKNIVRYLKEKGFTDVAYLAGGFIEWQKDKLPIKTNNNSSLSKPSFHQSTPKMYVKTSLGE